MLAVKIHQRRGPFTLNTGDSPLRFSPGEKVALLGENGSGKTTFLNYCTGIYPGGEIEYGPEEIWGLPRGNPPGAYLPQFASCALPFSVYEVVLFGRYRGIKQRRYREEDHRATQSRLQDFDLLDLQDRPITELSGGEKRRVMVARVVNQEARVLFFDEPLSSLDLRYGIMILERITQLEGLVFMALHDINLANHYCERFLCFKEGRLLYDLRQEEITPAILSEVYQTPIEGREGRFFTCLSP